MEGQRGTVMKKIPWHVFYSLVLMESKYNNRKKSGKQKCYFGGKNIHYFKNSKGAQVMYCIFCDGRIK